MPTLLVAGCHGNFIAEPIKAYLEDERYPLFCSRSLLETVGDYYPQFNTSRWNAIAPLDGSLERIETLHDAPGVIVLTSGDPLFYGIGKRLRNSFPDWTIRFFPAVSYMQSCFSHFGINWDDARFLSLHGRPLALLDTHLNCPKLFLFTDPENTRR